VKAVSNAGPLIALGKLGLIPLLTRLYSTVLVPMPVFEEVVTRGLELGQPDAYAVQMAIARQEIVVVGIELPESASTSDQPVLHAGERAAIELARQEQVDWLLFDDQLARERAVELGLHVRGTLGIIIEAYRKRLLSVEEVEIVFQAIIDRDDIWISDALVRRVWDAWREKEVDR
jgi:predicted nucleic acid-binding protein